MYAADLRSNRCNGRCTCVDPSVLSRIVSARISERDAGKRVSICQTFDRYLISQCCRHHERGSVILLREAVRGDRQSLLIEERVHKTIRVSLNDRFCDL